MHIAVILAQAAESEGSGIDLLVPAMEELIAGLIAFTLIFIVVWKWALPVYRSVTEARQQAIRGQFEAAEAAKDEAESLLTDYRAQLAGAKDEASRIVDDARQSGETVRAEVVARAESEAEAIRARAHDEISTERVRVAGELRRQVADLSLDVAEKVLAGSLDRDAQRLLVDRYIDDLGGVG